MAIVVPVAPTAPPSPPIQRGDRATFSDRVDQTITYLTAAPAEIGALATATYTNALDAAASAGTATSAAGTATGAASAASASATQAASSATGLIATSTTSVDIGLGSKVFTVQAGKMFQAGSRIYIVNPANADRWMSGVVASYNGTTLSTLIDDKNLSGTYASWNIGIAGPRGVAGAAGATGGVNGGSLTGALNFKQATVDVVVTATPDIWSGNGNTVKLSGAGTITGFTAAPQAGAERTLVVGAATTLTNGANLIVQGGTRTLVAGDLIDVVAEDSTTKFRASIRRANGLAPIQPAQTLALLGTAVVSSPVAAIDFLNVFTADYDQYMIQFAGFTLAAAGDVQLRFAKAGAVDAGSNYYNNTTASAQTRVATVVSANARFSGVADVFGINDSARCGLVARGVSATATQHVINDNVGGGYETGGGTVTGFRLLHSTGANFTAGTIRVYGVRNVAGNV